ncbi:MAG TPA: DUF547 domain-containing protein [Chitinophagales bacterium]|nr:DUF547 domain-containing protein [Chitinophagales bacterium]
MTAVILSQQLLFAVKVNQSFDHLVTELREKPEGFLIAELKDTDSRKTFWLNLYNAFVQILIDRHQPDFSTWKRRMQFFGKKCIEVSGNLLSLNDIEHGMLRNSSIWWSFGYFKKLSIKGFEKNLRIPLDFRIHFALNCGATDCPAISFYTAEKLTEQLDTAMSLFLDHDVIFNSNRTTCSISSLFKWYRKDFGGRSGTINLLSHHFQIPNGQLKSIAFKPYDWSVLKRNFNPGSKELKQV